MGIMLLIAFILLVLGLAFTSSTPPDYSGYRRYDCEHGILESLCAECEKAKR
jgi:hypothetical protein